MSTFPAPALNSNTAHLQRMLKAAGHVVTVSGKYWQIDNKLAYWPDSGKYKFSISSGGASGTLRGSAESTYEHIHQMLAAA
jgi:hypothetical protein